jgi:hypothetical protein
MDLLQTCQIMVNAGLTPFAPASPQGRTPAMLAVVLAQPENAPGNLAPFRALRSA